MRLRTKHLDDAQLRPSAMTDASGLATIFGLYPGSYIVRATPPVGFTQLLSRRSVASAGPSPRRSSSNSQPRSWRIWNSDRWRQRASARPSPARRVGLRRPPRPSRSSPPRSAREVPARSCRERRCRPTGFRSTASTAFRSVPLKPGVWLVALRPAGFDSWSWADTAETVEDATPVTTEPATEDRSRYHRGALRSISHRGAAHRQR